MKKAMASILSVLLLAVFSSCTQAAGVKSGAAAAESLIKLMPRSATGVVGIDVKRLMETDAVAKALQDPESKAKYDEFIQLSGIDPAKDIAYAALGLSGLPASGSGEPDGGVIVNLKYDRAKMLSLLKEKAPQAKEETYNGVTIYSDLDSGEAKQTTRAAFLDDAHIIFGSDAGIKGIIDVKQKKVDSLAKNPEMTAVLKKADKTGLVWGAFAIPPELIKKGVESSPQLKVLEGVKALTMAFDDRVSGFVADIRTLGGTKEQNANLASTLTGFKAMGAMFTAQEPALGELMNGIEITSGDDYTRLAITVSHELMEKLGKLAQSKAGELMKPKKDETGGEIRE